MIISKSGIEIPVLSIITETERWLSRKKSGSRRKHPNHGIFPTLIEEVFTF